MKRRRGSMKGIQPTPSNSSDLAETRGDQAVYWESRAERTGNQSRRYKQPAVCDHFAKIAARYDDLARRAREVGTEAENGQTLVDADPGQQERIRDALEDDEVREILLASRTRSA